ncbi:response regulator [Hufsiella ginkgonis]|uniref:Response regulator n=1 Tax=Hufsiella ginkgonis TaxID=2695274 RepID=A0A7K1XTI6_9SPHI|nr:response regulator transcription factor [Hufsiella ginkgonis]MXV14274.1 response regulator [Hufsiella ginkgonis]
MEKYKKRFSLILADDHPLYLEGLVSVLHGEFMITGIAADDKELFTLLKSSQPDVTLIGLKTPGSNGINAVREISLLYPEIKIILFSLAYDKALEEELKLAGIKGYLLRDVNVNTLADKINRVAAGEMVFDYDACQDQEMPRYRTSA